MEQDNSQPVRMRSQFAVQGAAELLRNTLDARHALREELAVDVDGWQGCGIGIHVPMRLRVIKEFSGDAIVSQWREGLCG